MSLVRRLKTRLRQLFRGAPRLRLDVRVPTERHGSEYGGWTICPTALDSRTVVYSFGIGEDTSFEESLIARYALRVEAFDPTPRSQKWLAQRTLPPTFRSHAYGLGCKDELRRLFFPSDPAHVSLSVMPACHSEQWIELPLRRLATVMTQLGDSTIQILKMDIEGAEYEVIEDLIASPIRPAQLLVEFHQYADRAGAQRFANAVRQLRDAGYALFAISDSGEEYSFLHRGTT